MMTTRARRFLFALAVMLLLGAIGLGALFARWPLPERISTPGSQVILDRSGAPLHVFLAPDDRWRIPLKLASVDPAYIDALLALEDSRFYFHPGVDPIAIVRAAFSNLKAGRVVSGASTITMQLVRMAEPRPRTLKSKAIEALRALQLSVFFTKDEILEAYLQLVPYGRNVEGVEAASLAYFGHRAGHLAPEEIALLLAIPQDPNRRYPTAANHPRLRAARGEIAADLIAAGVFGASVQKTIDGAPLPQGLGAFPRLAPHGSRYIASRAGQQSLVTSSLSRGAQALAEATLERHREGLALKGIHNGAVVVLDHKLGEVLALVGNMDFWDETHGGQYAAFATPRSVGSTLKPFIYAQGIDAGLLLPGMMTVDVPTNFGSYRPENYDGSFLGLVTFEDALSKSLNVPFVALLQRLGLDSFLGVLRDLGARSLKDAPGYYGLSAVAGGVELPPIEVAALFGALANGGKAMPLSLWPRELPPEGAQILSPGASFLTRETLSRRDRPDFPERRRMGGAIKHIHWKTGTSYGHRDAWAVGSNQRYTALVWLGNMNNDASRYLVGGEVAGPILFDLLEGLGEAGGGELPTPGDLKPIDVCALSGFAPSDACPSIRVALARERSVPTERCPYHVFRDVDLDSGLALTPDCREGRSFERRTFLQLPPIVRHYLRDLRGPLPGPPSLAPGCQGVSLGRAPVILSPPEGRSVVLLPGVEPSAQEVPFLASSLPSGQDLSWFVDGAFVGVAVDGERLWWVPTPGRHQLVVVDESGREGRGSVEVRGP